MERTEYAVENVEDDKELQKATSTRVGSGCKEKGEWFVEKQ